MNAAAVARTKRNGGRESVQRLAGAAEGVGCRGGAVARREAGGGKLADPAADSSEARVRAGEGSARPLAAAGSELEACRPDAAGRGLSGLSKKTK